MHAQESPYSHSNAPQSGLRARPLLGTLVSIRIDVCDGFIEQAFRAGFDAVSAVHTAMSFHEQGSELGRLNREAYRRPQSVGPDTWRVLCASLALARASSGHFDPTIAGRLVRDGFLPGCTDYVFAPDASWRDIVLGANRTVYFRKPLLLDFGGIAKGDAVDRAVRALRAAGVRSAMVNAGGDLRVFGNQEHLIQVRDPGAPSRSRPLLALREGAVATSASYFSKRAQRTPLVDPLSEAALGQNVSVSVCAPRAIWADALTKIVLADELIAVDMLRRLHASAVVLAADGSYKQFGA